ncbi:CDP-alcohol phosphatidyltransferase family protein [Gammaproteobacteria bacterium]|nr:CDP-alcohol phosphatidyltransferase family protein [Gammaproteobacteria bacterium]
MKFFIDFLTFFRLLAGPIIFILIILIQNFGLALIIFFLASISDYFDGFLARKFKLESLLGEVMDPTADKILTLFLIITLTVHFQSIFIAFIGSCMLAREFWVSALREINAKNNTSDATKVTFLAKIKTTVQFSAFGCFIFSMYANINILVLIANLLLFSSLIIALQTGLSYTMSSFKR